jgi:hypothetical protein
MSTVTLEVSEQHDFLAQIRQGESFVADEKLLFYDSMMSCGLLGSAARTPHHDG